MSGLSHVCLCTHLLNFIRDGDIYDMKFWLFMQYLHNVVVDNYTLWKKNRYEFQTHKTSKISNCAITTVWTFRGLKISKVTTDMSNRDFFKYEVETLGFTIFSNSSDIWTVISFYTMLCSLALMYLIYTDRNLCAYQMSCARAKMDCPILADFGGTKISRTFLKIKISFNYYHQITVAWYRCTTPVLFCGHCRSPPLKLENMGRERRWPRWIKKALHIGIKRLCIKSWLITASLQFWVCGPYWCCFIAYKSSQEI